MGNKEKDDGKLTKTMTPVEKERLLGELNKVESALSQNIGGINTLQGIQNEYFVTDKPSDNGSV